MADSGTIFDLTSTVEQIIAAERVYLDQRIAQNKSRETEVTDLSNIKSKINTFLNRMSVLQKPATFQSKKASISDTTIVSATPGVGASNLLFNIDVTQLAVAAKTQSTDVLFGASREGVKASVTGGEVNSGVGESLDANANAVSGDPNFGSGGNLTAGSFIINDAVILVTSSDTVNTILTKINNSSANVTAYYDSGNDKVVIEHQEYGDNYTVEFGDDSTGFFSKLKLKDDPGIVTAAGVDADLYRPLNETALGASVSYGYFTINNRTFIVNPDTDSLNDVISRINNSTAGVSLFYDVVSDRITMSSDTEGESIELINENSDFLRAVKLLGAAEETHTYTGTGAIVSINGTTFNPEGNELTIHGTTLKFLDTGDTSVSVETDNDKFVSGVKSMVEAYNNAVNEVESVIDKDSGSSRFLYRMITDMRQMLQSSISNDGTFNYLSDVGLTFSKGITGGRMELDEAEFRSFLVSEHDSVVRLFAGDSDNDGLHDDKGIAVTLRSYLRNYSQNSVGLIDRRSDSISRMTESIDQRIEAEEEYFANRQDVLLQTMIQMQRTLQVLQEEYMKASSIRVDFSLITGSSI